MSDVDRGLSMNALIEILAHMSRRATRRKARNRGMPGRRGQDRSTKNSGGKRRHRSQGSRGQGIASEAFGVSVPIYHSESELKSEFGFVARSVFDYLANNRFTRPARTTIERKALASRAIRFLANRYYNATTDAGRIAIYRRSAKIFRDHPAHFGSEEWQIDVPPFRVRLPLRGKDAWSDWDSALSALGHDPEVKDFYVKLLQSEFRPCTFVDVGANYGTHTALFLSAGVSCVAFEPNERCGDYFRRVMELNGFGAFRLEHVALGEAEGEAQLTFPESETWLGTLESNRTQLVGRESDLITAQVPVRRLDDMAIVGERCFVKIDAEGFEIRVIRGARTFLSLQCDFFVFESNTAEERKDIFSEITSIGFSIEALPMNDIHNSVPLNEKMFHTSTGTNFAARNSRASDIC